MSDARIVGIMTDKNEELKLYDNLPKRYLASDQNLLEESYKFVGEIRLEDITEEQNEEQIVVVNSWAYRARKEDGKVIRLRNGGYKNQYNGRFKQFRIMGIVKGRKLYIVIEPANERVKDIAEFAPIRITGVGQAFRKISQGKSIKD